MPSLGETYDAGYQDVAELVRLGLGFGLLVGGAAIYAPGVLRVVGDGALALGLPALTATRLGLTLALLSPPLVLAVLRARLPSVAGTTPVAAGGVLVGLAALGVWVTPVGAGVGELALPVVFAYAVGIVLLSAGVLAGPVAAQTRAGPAWTARSPAGFQRSNRSTSSGVTRADGGGDAAADRGFSLDDE